jgi:hypothetical protein
MAAQTGRATLRAGQASPGSTGFVGIASALGVLSVSVQTTTLLGQELAAIFVRQAAGA